MTPSPVGWFNGLNESPNDSVQTRLVVAGSADPATLHDRRSLPSSRNRELGGNLAVGESGAVRKPHHNYGHNMGRETAQQHRLE